MLLYDILYIVIICYTISARGLCPGALGSAQVRAHMTTGCRVEL